MKVLSATFDRFMRHKLAPAFAAKLSVLVAAVCATNAAYAANTIITTFMCTVIDNGKLLFVGGVILAAILWGAQAVAKSEAAKEFIVNMLIMFVVVFGLCSAAVATGFGSGLACLTSLA